MLVHYLVRAVRLQLRALSLIVDQLLMHLKRLVVVMIRLIEARLQDQFHLLFLVFFIVVSLGLILLQLRHLHNVLLTHKSAFVLRLLARLVLQIIWQYECVVLVPVFLNSGVLN